MTIYKGKNLDHSRCPRYSLRDEMRWARIGLAEPWHDPYWRGPLDPLQAIACDVVMSDLDGILGAEALRLAMRRSFG